MTFLIIVLTVLGLIHGYVGFRIIPSLGLASPWIISVWILIIVLTLLPIAGPILRFQGFENRLTDILSWVGYTSLGFFVLTFLTLIARDLGWTLWTGGTTLISSAQKPVFNPDRRDALIYLMNIGLLTMTSGLSAYGFYQARRDPKIIEVDIPINGLPKPLHGFRIVQISDLHVGPTIKRDFVEGVVKQVQNLNPDLIAMTGDLVDGSVRHLAHDVAPLVDLSAPYGKYFVTGNHEYYSGVDLWLQKTQELGFTTLVNENVTVDIHGAKLNISGVTDLMATQVNKSHATDPDKAMLGVPQDSTKLMLAHQPGSINDAQRLGVDLLLAGHTHGGQFKPFDFAVSKAHLYIAGLHNHKGTWIYVNRGTGYWGPPLRIGIPNEITVLTLKQA